MSEDLALEALTEFLDAVEAGIAAAKQRIKDAKKLEEKPSWDPVKIKWIETQGSKGLYQRYPAEGQKAEATLDYKMLIEDLKAHGDHLTRDHFFYWLFPDFATVGRKQRA